MFNSQKKISDKQRGFSLIELMIAMTITLLLLGVVAGILAGIQREYKFQKPRMEALHNANTAMDTIVRLLRMAGTKPPQCTSLTFQGLTPSQADGTGNYSTLRVQSDWNPADCALSGVEEDVTFSVSSGNLYIDAAKLNPFVDKINALRFKFYSSNNLLISDAVTNQGQISLVQIEIDTIAVDGNTTTIKSAVQLRSR